MENHKVSSITFVVEANCTCNGCKEKFSKLKKKNEGVHSISIDAERRRATITGTARPSQVVEELRKYGKIVKLLREESLPSPKHSKGISVPQRQIQKVVPTTEGTRDDRTKLCDNKRSQARRGGAREGRIDNDRAREGRMDDNRARDELLLQHCQSPTTPVSVKHSRQPSIVPDESIVRNDLPPKHQHRLKLIKDNKRFACDGCKMDGFDKRYRCEDCTYELHKACNKPIASISPEFFPELTFKFFNKAPSNSHSHSCVACGNVIQGHFYFCKKKAGLYLHPSCSKLPAGKFIGETAFVLANNEQSLECMWCRKEKGVPGWLYVSPFNTYCLHVRCIAHLEHEAWKQNEKKRTYRDVSTDYNKELMDVKLKDMLKRKKRRGFEYWKPLCSFLRAIIGVLFGDVSGIVPIVVTIIQLLSN